jgi:hypothetical protein
VQISSSLLSPFLPWGRNLNIGENNTHTTHSTIVRRASSTASKPGPYYIDRHGWLNESAGVPVMPEALSSPFACCCGTIAHQRFFAYLCSTPESAVQGAIHYRKMLV